MEWTEFNIDVVQWCSGMSISKSEGWIVFVFDSNTYLFIILPTHDYNICHDSRRWSTWWKNNQRQRERKKKKNYLQKRSTTAARLQAEMMIMIRFLCLCCHRVYLHRTTGSSWIFSWSDGFRSRGFFFSSSCNIIASLSFSWLELGAGRGIKEAEIASGTPVENMKHCPEGASWSSSQRHQYGNSIQNPVTHARMIPSGEERYFARVLGVYTVHHTLPHLHQRQPDVWILVLEKDSFRHHHLHHRRHRNSWSPSPSSSNFEIQVIERWCGHEWMMMISIEGDGKDENSIVW